jgi:hypothetical protein
MAAAHPEIAGVVLDNPLDRPTDAMFNDSRARLVPAQALVRDRWDSDQPAASLRVPSLWFYRTPSPGQPPIRTDAYEKVIARKMRVWLNNSPDIEANYTFALSRWLDDLSGNRQYR